jgi:hypothetical protein
MIRHAETRFLRFKTWFLNSLWYNMAMVSQQARPHALLEFAFRSLPQAYGRIFLQDMVLHHPLRAVRGFWAYWRISTRGPTAQRSLSNTSEATWITRATNAGERLLVATGFCQKPLRTGNRAYECPAGRFNHNCLYLSHLELGVVREGPLHPACAICPIRELGYVALQAGASFAILTSALDIAHNILLPSLKEQRFTDALFAICPYSLEPMSLALLICGLDGYLFRYDSGACADYSQWLRADHGDKPEQTTLSAPGTASLLYLLETIATGRAEENLLQPTGYELEGNVFRPT